MILIDTHKGQPRLRMERRKSASLRTWKRGCVKSYPKRNEEHATTTCIIKRALNSETYFLEIYDDIYYIALS